MSCFEGNERHHSYLVENDLYTYVQQEKVKTCHSSRRRSVQVSLYAQKTSVFYIGTQSSKNAIVINLSQLSAFKMTA